MLAGGISRLSIDPGDYKLDRDIFKNSITFLSLSSTQMEHVCLPRQPSAQKFVTRQHVAMALLSGNNLQCLRGRFKARNLPLLLGKPPLDNNIRLAVKT